MAQRVGPVTIDDNGDDDDLTVIQVPSEAVGFVTGSQGNFLRQVEEEWGTLMFFADFRSKSRGEQVPSSTAATFTRRRARRSTRTTWGGARGSRHRHRLVGRLPCDGLRAE